MAFILVASDKAGQIGVYTGKAGPEWVSNKSTSAFEYTTEAEAQRKAALFNSRATLHNMQFAVMYRLGDFVLGPLS